MNKYCWSPGHDTPCPLPCSACEMDCDEKDWEDSDVNRQRTKEWDARRGEQE